MSGVAVPGAARAADANHVSALSRSAACSRQGEQVNIVSCEHQHPSPALSGYDDSHLSRVWVASDAGSVGVLPGHAAGLTQHLALAHHQVTLYKAPLNPPRPRCEASRACAPPRGRCSRSGRE